MPVAEKARVETNMRGPGMTPRLMAGFTSTSAYIAPSVSRSRITVKPLRSAMLKTAVARSAARAYRPIWTPRRKKLFFLVGGGNVALQKDVGMTIGESWKDGRQRQVYD